MSHTPSAPATLSPDELAALTALTDKLRRSIEG